MTAVAVKNNFHQLIDSIDDTDLLQQFYEALYLLKQHPVRSEITDELNQAQKKRLEASLSQSANGQTISNEAMKLKLKQWLSR